MRSARDFYFKWIDAKDPRADGLDLKLVQHGLVYAQDAGGRITGFTIFEAGRLGAEFADRLRRRMRSSAPGLKFCLVIPRPLAQRAAGLFASDNVTTESSPFIHLRLAGGVIAVRTKLRVVSVDDSEVLLKLLRHTMVGMGFVDVAAQVSDPWKAVDIIEKIRPDVVTLDIQMPRMTGVDVVRDLMARAYYPVVVVSSLSLDEGSLVFEALNAGAFDYLSKPSYEERPAFQDQLEEKLLLAVNGEWRKPAATRRLSEIGYDKGLLWCLGASTGGTQALTEVFRGLPAQIPPTLVVQHIPPVFSRAFADSLNSLCPFTVKEAEDGEPVQADHVYIAAGGLQMGIGNSGGSLRITLRDDPPVNRFKPSVDYLFDAVARLKGRPVVAGLLTGMGRDGAEGLMKLKAAGARTFVQNESTSAVYGMPRAAFEMGAAEKQTPLDQIAQELLSFSARLKNTG